MIFPYILLFLCFGLRPLKSFQTRPSFSSHQKAFLFSILALALSTLCQNPVGIQPLGRVLVLGAMGYLAWKGLGQLPRQDLRRFTMIFFSGYLFYVGFYVLEILSQGFMSRLHKPFPSFNAEHYLRATVILTLLSVPAALASLDFRKYKPMLQFSLGGALVFILFHSRPDAARLAAFAGIFIGALTLYAPIYGKRSLTILSTLGVLSPLLFFYLVNEHTLGEWMRLLPTSYQHRLQIWYIFSSKILNHSSLLQVFLGHGFDSSTQLQDAAPRCAYFDGARYALEKQAPVNAIVSTVPFPWGGVVCYQETALGRHCHNGFLQIWYEFGMVGILALWILVDRIGKTLLSLPRIRAAAGFTLLAVYAMFWSISFNIWQNWMICLCSMSFILLDKIGGLRAKEGK